MANPNFNEVFNTDELSVNNALQALGLNPVTDARTAAASILDLLARNYKIFTDSGTNLTAYTIVEEFENVDLTTQSQNFTISLQRNISIGGVQDEPTV